MKCVKVKSYVVEGGTDTPSPLWGGCLFVGSSPVVDTNDLCGGLGRCAVGGGVGRPRPPHQSLVSTLGLLPANKPPSTRGTNPVCTSLHIITL
jgi:hypothetical protein